MLFRTQSTNFMHVAGRYWQQTKANGVALVSAGVAAGVASELSSLLHVPPVVEAMGAVALFAQAVHKRRESLQEVQELTWHEYFLARNPGMEREEPSAEGQVFKRRSLFPLFFAGLMAADATISVIDEDIAIIPPGVVAFLLDRYVDFLENSQTVDPNRIADIKRILEELRSHSDKNQ